MERKTGSERASEPAGEDSAGNASQGAWVHAPYPLPQLQATCPVLSLLLRGYENQGMSIKLIHSWKSWLKWVFKTISIFLGWKGQISTGYVKRKTKAGSQAIPPKTSSAPNRETQSWSVLSKELIKMNPNKTSEVSCTGALAQVTSLLKTLSLEPCP